MSRIAARPVYWGELVRNVTAGSVLYSNFFPFTVLLCIALSDDSKV